VDCCSSRAFIAVACTPVSVVDKLATVAAPPVPAAVRCSCLAAFCTYLSGGDGRVLAPLAATTTRNRHLLHATLLWLAWRSTTCTALRVRPSAHFSRTFLGGCAYLFSRRYSYLFRLRPRALHLHHVTKLPAPTTYPVRACQRGMNDTRCACAADGDALNVVWDRTRAARTPLPHAPTRILTLHILHHHHLLPHYTATTRYYFCTHTHPLHLTPPPHTHYPPTPTTCTHTHTHCPTTTHTPSSFVCSGACAFHPGSSHHCQLIIHSSS